MRDGWSSASGRTWGCATWREGSAGQLGAECIPQAARGARNDVFPQGVEMGRELGLGKWGTVAIDWTRIRGKASRDRIDTEPRLRNERARRRRQIRRWQKACEASDPDEGAGTRVQVEKLEQRRAELPGGLERLRKSGEVKRSGRDSEARFRRERGGFALGYTGEIAVSEDPFIVAERVTLHRCDVPALVPRVEEVEQRSRARPQKVLGDAGFYRHENVRVLQERGMQVYLPDPNLARELHTGKRARTMGRNRVRSPETENDAEKVAQSGGTTNIRTTKGLGGTGVRSAEAAAGNAAIPHPRTRASSG